MESERIEFLHSVRWMCNGKFHRLNGPAVERHDGRKEWWIEGKNFKSEEDWFEALQEKDKLAYLFRI